jgi:serine/threonine protein kinase
MVFGYAENGDCNNWVNKNYGNFTWEMKLRLLVCTIHGLIDIHQKQLVHHNFHPGNILLGKNYFDVLISDMELEACIWPYL